MPDEQQQPTYPIHPGEVLADELAELGMTSAAVARALHVPSNRIYQLVAGKRGMTADTRIATGGNGWVLRQAFWMNLQKTYELDLAAEQSGDEIRRTVAHRQPSQPEQLMGFAPLGRQPNATGSRPRQKHGGW